MQPLTEQTFDAALEAAPGLVLVDFWAGWCGPCRAVTPILEGLAPDYAGRVDFVKVNVDENQGLSGAFGVKSLPTVLVLAPHGDRPGAAVVGAMIGARPPEAYRKLLDKILNPRPSLLGRLKRALSGGGAADDDDHDSDASGAPKATEERA